MLIPDWHHALCIKVFHLISSMIRQGDPTAGFSLPLYTRAFQTISTVSLSMSRDFIFGILYVVEIGTLFDGIHRHAGRLVYLLSGEPSLRLSFVEA